MNSKERVQLHKGMDYVRRKDFERALEIFQNVIASNPEIPEAWNNQGVALFGLGRIDEALESYSRSISLDPANLDALRNKAFLLRNQRRLQEALEVYDTVLEKGGDAIDLESTAIVLTAMGRLEEALHCLYLAREKLSLPRLEDEIEIVQKKILERGGQSGYGAVDEAGHIEDNKIEDNKIEDNKIEDNKIED
ncbi:MAG TPA: tetratricopeptide repeat protein, partial [Methanothrix sp.]|nr:tetratricopeptide repeat protein [Methanothrix sp.]